MKKYQSKSSYRPILLTLTAVFICYYTPYAQTGEPSDVFKNQMTEKIKPVSPNSAAFEKVSLLPTDLSTGTATIAMPIFQVAGKKLNLPITLSYQAKGIKVEEDASWVGLGWTLDAGGVIVQEVRGMAETGMSNNQLSPERAGPFPTQPTMFNDAEDAYLRSIYNYPVGSEPANWYIPEYIKDPSPDIFIYNFCGLSGKFVLKNDGTAVFSPKQNYKVVFGGLSNTTIIDDKGNKYIFTKPETSWTSASASSTDFTYATYLTQIVSADGSEVINLSYVSESHIHYPLPAYDALVDENGLNVENVGYASSGIEVVRLTEINTNFGLKVQFIQDDLSREDLLPGNNVKALKQIEIYQNNSLFKTYKLDKEYVRTSYEVSTSSYSTLIPNPDYLNKRLYLKGLQVFNSDLTKNIPPYTFTYYGRTANNLDLLPNKFSYAQDHWGFFNGQLSNTGLCPGYIGPYFEMLNSGGIMQVNAPGANREASFPSSMYGVIKNVKYPTGAQTELYYEPHTYNEVEIITPDIPNGNTTGIAGGVRIQKQMISDPMTNKTLVKEYTYERGRVCNPVYGSWVIKNQEGFLSYSQHVRTDGTWINKGKIRMAAKSIYNLFSYNGSHIYYEKVTEKETGNGRTEYNFSPVSLELPALSDRIHLLQSNVVINGNCCHAVETYPIILVGIVGYNPGSNALSQTFSWNTKPPIARNWLYGHLLTKQIFTEANQLLSSQESKYDFQDLNYHNNNVEVFDNINVNVNLYGPGPQPAGSGGNLTGGWFIGPVYYRYPTYMGTSLVDKNTNSLYDANNNVIENEDEFTYNSRLDPATVVRTKSDGSKTITKYKYAYDYNFDCSTVFSNEVAALKKLVEKNIINSPVEEQVIQERNGVSKLISSKLITFQTIGNNVYPKALYVVDQKEPLTDLTSATMVCVNGTVTLAKHPQYTKRVDYLTYDSKGNLSEFIDQKGVTTSLLWSAYIPTPVAQVVGSDYNTVGNLINQSVLDDPNSADLQIRNELNNLRTGLAQTKALITTYTYKALFGMSSQTDPNGKTIYYQYDAFGRLFFIEDQNHNIVKKFCYNYAGQPEACTLFASAAISDYYYSQNCSSGLTPESYYTNIPAAMFTANSQAEADQLAQAYAQNQANQNGTCSNQMICLNGYDQTGYSCIVQLTDVNTYMTYFFETQNYGSGVIGCVPEGVYDITISAGPYSNVFYSAGCSYTNSSSGGATFSNVSINSSCNYISTNY